MGDASAEQMLALVDSTIADVHSVRASGERLLEVLADAASSTPTQLAEQVSGILEQTMLMVSRATASWSTLQQMRREQHAQQGNAKAQAAERAVQASLAVDAMLRDAASLATASAADQPPDAATLDPARQAGALEEVARRVALITGHQLALCGPAAGAAPAAAPAACPPEAATEVRLTLGDQMVAVVALAAPGTLEAVRVAAFPADDPAGAWLQSSSPLFQRISAWAMLALGRFRQQPQPLVPGLPSQDQAAVSLAAAAAPLEDLLLWLTGYDDLYSHRCDATGTLLAADAATQHFFPPYLRPIVPSRRHLIGAARSRDSRRAYHPHAAPHDVLAVDGA